MAGIPVRMIVIAVSVVVGSAAARADPPLTLAAPAAPVDNPAAVAAVEASVPAPKVRRTGRFTLSAGFSADEGFLAGAGVAQDDLFGSGQRLTLDAALSARRQEYRLAHDAPGVLGAGIDLRSELHATQRRHAGFTRDGIGGALTLGQRLGGATRIYARYRVEQVGVTVDDPVAAARAAMPPSLGSGRLATLGAGVVYDTLDLPALATRGTRLELFAERGGRWLGSEHDLLRVIAAADHARALGPLTVRLQGRGAFVHSRDPGGVPLSERLQHDGHAEVRGYGLGALGPLTPGGDRVGGAELEASGRLEVELPVWRAAGLSIAGFVDAGLRYNGDPAWGPTGAQASRSIGASIIWRSPIGPLRFDWAIPLDGRDRDPVFLFGVGGPL